MAAIGTKRVQRPVVVEEEVTFAVPPAVLAGPTAFQQLREVFRTRSLGMGGATTSNGYVSWDVLADSDPLGSVRFLFSVADASTGVILAPFSQIASPNLQQAALTAILVNGAFDTPRLSTEYQGEGAYGSPLVLGEQLGASIALTVYATGRVLAAGRTITARVRVHMGGLIGGG